ncbi:MAG: xanthine dehydrogenase family protein subunit M [Actinomycetota bacterium]|nr:xanthine dehydrogenase family protein subunit M [Actinomycetota bacterium]
MQVPAPFEYERATSVDDALERLNRLGPEARLLAGGHSLLPMMKLRLAAPEHLVDINELESELSYITEEGGEVRIGAMTRHRDIFESELLARRLTMFIDAERVIADPVVRNRGTIGGALCQADPAEDLSSVCAALSARAVVRGPEGERVIDMEEFRVSPYETAVADGEMLIEVRVPLHENAGSAYEKVERRVGDWAVAAAGAAVRMDGAQIGSAGIALTAVGAEFSPTRAQDALAGQPPSAEAFAAAGQIASEDCSPTTDQRGSADYKRHLAKELTERALRRAVARAVGEEA